MIASLLLILLTSPTTQPQSQPAREFPYRWSWGLPADRKQQDELLGEFAPELKLTDWLNTQKVPKTNGKIIVLDFWATWCPPCAELVPFNNQLLNRFSSKDVVLIGVCTDAGQDKLGDFVRKHGVEYCVARDPNGTAAKHFRIATYPTYVVIDRSGRIRAIALQKAYLARVIDALLEEPSPAAR